MKYKTLQGWASSARLTVRGKIRLGLPKPQGKRQPGREVPYFVCPPEIQEALKVEGRADWKEPAWLSVLLPCDDISEIMPTRLELYRGGGPETDGGWLFCEGDGQEATRMCHPDEKFFTAPEGLPPGARYETDCPYRACPDYQQGNCSERGRLYVVIPQVSLWDCYQIVTGSTTSTTNVLSALTRLQAMTNGRLHYLVTGDNKPVLKLRRQQVTIPHWDETKKGIIRTTHYCLVMDTDLSVGQFTELLDRAESRQLETPRGVKALLPADNDEPAEDFYGGRHAEAVPVVPGAVAKSLTRENRFGDDAGNPPAALVPSQAAEGTPLKKSGALF